MVGEGFLCLLTWNPNIKAINKLKLMQMIFNAWFRYLPFFAWCNIDCSQLMFWSNCYQLQLVYPNLGALSSQKSPAWNCKPLLDRHSRNLFAFQLHFYISVAIKHNLPKMLLFSSLWILKWLQKKSPILIHFLKCTLIWQLSWYNLTKLFLMKLKTSTTQAIYGKKWNELFWPTQWIGNKGCFVIHQFYTCGL